MSRIVPIFALIVAAFVTTGCEQEGPAERAGEALDEAAESLGDAGNDIGNAVEDACEDLKEGAGAEDKDC